MMTNLLGEYDCKVDAKGRMMFPSSLKKQFGDAFDGGFVVSRNLHEKCLVLHPTEEWRKKMQKLSKLNRLVKKNDKLVRKIMNGATEVKIDGAGRMLLPKPLVEYASIVKEIKVVGSGAIIEIWDKKCYLDEMAEEVDLEGLAEDVFGSIDFDE